MDFGIHRTKAALIAVGLAALFFASSAAAESPLIITNPVTPFSCRASVARVTLLNSIKVEPLVANAPDYPCATDQHGLSAVNVAQTSAPAVNAGPAGVVTYSKYTPGSTESPGAAAVADVQGVVIPSTSGVITVVGPVEANAAYACSNGALTSSSGSTLDIINVAGKNMTLPAPGTPETIQLGGGNYIAVNEKITTPTSITERILDVHLAGIADIVVGEASVDVNRADPCAGSGGPPPNTNACPPGSTLDPVRLLCVIVLSNGQEIVIGPPFTGPSGGTVLALSVARQKYGGPCTTGPGPQYALIATKPHGRVTGTLKADRIIALGAFERIAGLGGNDCVDGRSHNQQIWEGNGRRVRVYGGPGTTRIGMGNGNDLVYGRKGKDWITAGNGNDTIHGGSGNSRLDVGLGRSHIYGGPGRNRVFAGSDAAVVNCGSGKHNIAFVRIRVSKYARKHGCQKVFLLK
jgi:Ca2+-binding RTX toxin-like protein